jgi:hypothetical protein
MSDEEKKDDKDSRAAEAQNETPPPVHALSGFGHPLKRPGVVS